MAQQVMSLKGMVWMSNEKQVTWSFVKTLFFYLTTYGLAISFVVALTLAWGVVKTGYNSLKYLLLLGTNGNQAPLTRALGFTSVTEFSQAVDKWVMIGLIFCGVLVLIGFVRDFIKWFRFKRGASTRRDLMRLRDLMGWFTLMAFVFFVFFVGLVFYGFSDVIAKTDLAKASGFLSPFVLDDLLVVAIGFMSVLLLYFIRKTLLDLWMVPHLAQYTGPGQNIHFDKVFKILKKTPVNSRQMERRYPKEKGSTEKTLKGERDVVYYLYVIRPLFVFPYVFIEAPGVRVENGRKPRIETGNVKVVERESLMERRRRELQERDYSDIGEVVKKKKTERTRTDRPFVSAAKKKYHLDDK